MGRSVVWPQTTLNAYMESVGTLESSGIWPNGVSGSSGTTEAVIRTRRTEKPASDDAGGPVHRLPGRRKAVGLSGRFDPTRADA